VTSNIEEGKDGEGKDEIWILGMSQWTSWKGGSSEKEIQEIWAASGTPIPIKHDEDEDKDEDTDENEDEDEEGNDDNGNNEGEE
jgi:hypothetical protein